MVAEGKASFVIWQDLFFFLHRVNLPSSPDKLDRGTDVVVDATAKQILLGYITPVPLWATWDNLYIYTYILDALIV